MRIPIRLLNRTKLWGFLYSPCTDSVTRAILKHCQRGVEFPLKIQSRRKFSIKYLLNCSGKKMVSGGPKSGGSTSCNVAAKNATCRAHGTHKLIARRNGTADARRRYCGAQTGLLRTRRRLSRWHDTFGKVTRHLSPVWVLLFRMHP